MGSERTQGNGSVGTSRTGVCTPTWREWRWERGAVQWRGWHSLPAAGRLRAGRCGERRPGGGGDTSASGRRPVRTARTEACSLSPPGTGPPGGTELLGSGAVPPTSGWRTAERPPDPGRKNSFHGAGGGGHPGEGLPLESTGSSASPTKPWEAEAPVTQPPQEGLSELAKEARFAAHPGNPHGLNLVAIAFLGLVEFFANAPVFSALLPRDPLSEEQIRLLAEGSHGEVGPSGFGRVISHIVLKADAALLAGGWWCSLCVLAHFFGHSLRSW